MQTDAQFGTFIPLLAEKWVLLDIRTNPVWVDLASFQKRRGAKMDFDGFLTLAIPLGVLFASWWLYALDRQDREDF